MVELVDTQDLESCEETRTGSIPAIRTILNSTPFSRQIDVKKGVLFMDYLEQIDNEL